LIVKIPIEYWLLSVGSKEPVRADLLTLKVTFSALMLFIITINTPANVWV